MTALTSHLFIACPALSRDDFFYLDTVKFDTYEVNIVAWNCPEATSILPYMQKLLEQRLEQPIKTLAVEGDICYLRRRLKDAQHKITSVPTAVLDYLRTEFYEKHKASLPQQLDGNRLLFISSE